MTDEQITAALTNTPVLALIKEILSQRDQFIHLYCDTAGLDIAERLKESNNGALVNGD